MVLIKNTFLFLFIFNIYEHKAFALTDYQIKEICRKERRLLKCKNNLQKKRFDLMKGNRIEIPVVPFKK